MYTVFVNGNEIRFINENRALRVAKQNNTVVFGLNRNITHKGEWKCKRCGSTAIAARKLCYKYLGFEIDKKTFDNAQKRINNEFSQMSLFWD